MMTTDHNATRLKRASAPDASAIVSRLRADAIGRTTFAGCGNAYGNVTAVTPPDARPGGVLTRPAAPGARDARRSPATPRVCAVAAGPERGARRSPRVRRPGRRLSSPRFDGGARGGGGRAAPEPRGERRRMHRRPVAVQPRVDVRALEAHAAEREQ